MVEPKIDVAPPEAVAVATTRSIELTGVATRSEHDLIGNADVPWNAYWGIHTLRAVDNFPITGVSVGHFPEFVRALVLVKQAAARANRRLGHLPAAKADVIDRACDLIAKDGRYHDQFVVDAIQGGAGTSTNMNTNEEDIARLTAAAALFREVNLGATAIGTGINADPRYAALAIEALSRASHEPMVPASNLIEATSDMGAFVLFSGVLKRVAVKLSKICNDLRLLSSGPRAGFAEIRLPTVQAGSSIMPGKVNPVIPEVVNQVAYMVIGHDLTVTMCAEGGQLQLNAFEPTIGYCVLSSLRTLAAAVNTLVRKCVVGIEADRERCRALVEDSIGLVTALVYETCSRVDKQALAQ